MVVITQGENKIIYVTIRGNDGKPFDLTGFTKYKVALPTATGSLVVSETVNDNGSIVELSGNALLGTLKVTLNYVDTATLRVGTAQNIGVKIDNNSDSNPKSELAEKILTVRTDPVPA